MRSENGSCALRATAASGWRARISRRRFAIATGLWPLAFATRGGAQVNPEPFTLIIPAPPGGSLDALGRLAADNLADLMGARVGVENVGGNGGVDGMNAIAAAPRDGSVLGIVTSSALIAGRLLSSRARYNPAEDFAWLTILGSFANALILSTRSNDTTFAGWLAHARSAATPLVYASFGTGTAGHLAGAYLRYHHGANLTHVTLASIDNGYAMLSEGHIDVLFDGVPNALVKVPRSGHRIVAVTSATRSAPLPDVPSFGEMFPESFTISIGLVLPNGVPPAVHVRFASAIGVLVSERRYIDGLRAAGVEFMGLSGSGTRAYVENEFLHVAKLIGRLNDEGMRR